MPISKARRLDLHRGHDLLSLAINIRTPGDLNYILTFLVRAYLQGRCQAPR